MNITHEEARKLLVEAGHKLVAEGLVTRTWGNISMKISETEMLITPSGLPYDKLGPEHMVTVNFKTGKASHSTLRPSSEFPLHAAIYSHRPDVAAIVHTHQAYASTCAAARREVPPILDDMAQIIGPSVRCSHYALSGTRKLAREVVKALHGRNAALIANHGAICVGRDLDEAFVVCQILEKSCKSFIEAEFMGGAKSIGRFKAWMLHLAYRRRYSQLARKLK